MKNVWDKVKTSLEFGQCGWWSGCCFHEVPTPPHECVAKVTVLRKDCKIGGSYTVSFTHQCCHCLTCVIWVNSAFPDFHRVIQLDAPLVRHGG